MARTVKASELAALRHKLAGLCDARLEEVYWAYPGELVIVFKDEHGDGGWTLETVASPWALLDAGALAARRGDEREAIDRSFKDLEGSKVTAVSIRREDLALSLQIGGRATFTLLTARPRSAPGGTPPLWQLGMPSMEEAIAQRNGCIDIVPSDVPIQELERNGFLRL